MQIFINPKKADWPQIIQRPTMDLSVVFDKVKPILAEVKLNGDMALRQYALQFDGIELDILEVTDEEKVTAQNLISDELKVAIQQAVNNITAFHKKQITTVDC